MLQKRQISLMNFLARFQKKFFDIFSMFMSLNILIEI